jgi:hypothetical protein
MEWNAFPTLCHSFHHVHTEIPGPCREKGTPLVIFGTSRTLSPGKSQCMGTGTGCQGLDVYFPFLYKSQNLFPPHACLNI